MPQGLQIWDTSGNLVFDTNTNAGRVLGNVTVTASTAGSATNAGLTTGRPFWIFQVTTTQYFTKQPAISVSGTTISWDNTAEENGYIVYGVY